MTAPLPARRVGITARVALTCLGRGRAAHLAALRAGRSGLTPCDFPGAGIPCFIGRVAGVEDDPAPAPEWDNRATRLLTAALATDGFGEAVEAALARWGRGRVGVVLGTSTSGIERAERAFRARGGDGPLDPAYSMRHHNDYHALAGFLIARLGIGGPGYTVSTACSSSAKAIVDGVQMIRLGLADAVLAGGADSLCLTSLYGFEALELVSRGPCRPCDAGRDGLSIGEGAGLLLLERDGEGPRLAGHGESSDAVNMSTPPADGAGAAAAMRQALARAGLAPDEVGLVKLHGTATPANDAAEAAAVAAVFGAATPAASLKGMIGHTLGAAGAVEAVLCLDAMEAGLLPANVGLRAPGPEIGLNLVRVPAPAEIAHAACNAFGFGGSNAVLVLSRA